MPQKFFITHSWKDIDFTRKLCNDLIANGLDGFFDERSVRPGESIPKRIEQGLETCDVYIPVFSPDALKSRWADWEIDMAIMMNREQGRPHIMPVIAEKCDVPRRLRHILYVDFVGRYDDALNDLLTKGFDVTPIPPRSVDPPPPPPKNPEPAQPFPSWLVPVGVVVGMLVLAIVLGFVVNGAVNNSIPVLPTKVAAGAPTIISTLTPKLTDTLRPTETWTPKPMDTLRPTATFTLKPTDMPSATAALVLPTYVSTATRVLPIPTPTESAKLPIPQKRLDLAFETSTWDGKQYLRGINIIDLATSKQSRFLDSFNRTSAVWSTDGKRVLWVSYDSSQEIKSPSSTIPSQYNWIVQSSLRTASESGGGTSILWTVSAQVQFYCYQNYCEEVPKMLENAIFSPNGQKIAASYRDSTANKCPSILNADGTGVRMLPMCERDDHPRFWSVDGKWIVAWSERGLKLYAYEVDGNRRIPLEQLGKIQVYDQRYWPWKITDSPVCKGASFWDCE